MQKLLGFLIGRQRVAIYTWHPPLLDSHWWHVVLAAMALAFVICLSLYTFDERTPTFPGPYVGGNAQTYPLRH